MKSALRQTPKIALVAALGVLLAACGATVASHHRSSPIPAAQTKQTPTPTGTPVVAPTAIPTATPNPTVDPTPSPVVTSKATPTPKPTVEPTPITPPTAKPTPLPWSEFMFLFFNSAPVTDLNGLYGLHQTMEIEANGKVIYDCGFYDTIGPSECTWTGLSIGGLFATGKTINYTAVSINLAGQVLATSNVIAVTTVQPSNQAATNACVSAAKLPSAPPVSLCISWW